MIKEIKSQKRKRSWKAWQECWTLACNVNKRKLDTYGRNFFVRIWHASNFNRITTLVTKTEIAILFLNSFPSLDPAFSPRALKPGLNKEKSGRRRERRRERGNERERERERVNDCVRVWEGRWARGGKERREKEREEWYTGNELKFARECKTNTVCQLLAWFLVALTQTEA